MFNFREIDITDKDRINACLAVSDFQGCEYCFANNFAWRRLNNTLIDFYDDFYISCSFRGSQPIFTFPAGVKLDDSGRNKYFELFGLLKKQAEEQGHRLIISSVTKENLEWIKSEYGEKIAVSGDASSFDYIYSSEDLASISGRRYHGKRNHIKRLKDKPYEVRRIRPEDFDYCIAFAANSYNVKNKDSFSSVVEQYAIHKFFSDYDSLELDGVILYSDDKFAGFAIGGQLNSDTFDVHIEKADANIQGAYPMLCNELAKIAADKFKYINREEDLGLEGLKKSKLSYHPLYLLEKYTISFL
ncbi:MAG: phosphatidylglycerol lysyltransferase domain-containing protein [Ruminococcus sp.]|nr:phosphatidylglycerol lysyltransferase domain-containing protein [Ruminococcus sp.]